MGIEFLGNKRQLEDFIISNIKNHTDSNCINCLDAFSGSGSVSIALKKNGYSVTANDFLASASVITSAVLLNQSEPRFEKVITKEHIETGSDPYNSVLNYLNALEGKSGFVYRNYSPASVNNSDIERMYFTEENAKKIDAIRMKILEWKNYLEKNEEALLLTDLIHAVSGVSNIAGTYGCYMKYWKKKAIAEIRLKKSEIIPGKLNRHYYVTNENIDNVIGNESYDIIYADPPYTKRQYSAYYHLLETIVLYDNPEIEGSTGLRNWKEKSSDFCYKRKAPRALERMLSKAKCKYFVMSYNDEGQIQHEKILEILGKYGEITVKEAEYKRYKSNSASNQRKDVIERLYILRMEK